MTKMQLNRSKYRILGILACIIVTIVIVVGVHKSAWITGEGSEQSIIQDKAQLNHARLQAHLPACVDDFSHPQRKISPHWSAISTICLATGAQTSFGQALGGKRTLVNLWAYWCGPCQAELPIIQKFAQKHADKVQVLLVHIDQNDIEGLDLLHQLHINLPCITDYHKNIRLALGVPSVVPVSVLIAADGKVEHLYSQSFDSLRELEQVVHI